MKRNRQSPRLAAALDRVDRRLFPRKWRETPGTAARRATPSGVQRALIGALSAAFVALFIVAAARYAGDESVFRLLFVLTKGGIFVVFTLFFLFSSGQRGLYSFLTFAFFSTLETLLAGATGVFLAKILATNALLGYLTEFCEVPPRPRAFRAIPLAAVAAVGVMLFDHGWGTHSVTAQDLSAMTGGYLVGAVGFGLLLGALTLRMWRREGFPASATRSLRNLIVSLSIYLLLLVWDAVFNTAFGFDKRALFDLLLFYYMAFNTANELGHREGQVRSLQGHMREKRRMELELQEAAEIARAFMPQSLPAWPAFAVAAFHDPLTESSGDWFAFESARARQLRHFILCDVTGHGVQAAIVVSSCKTALSLIAQNFPEALEEPDFVARFARILNGVLFSHGEGQHISTILGLTFDADAGVLHYLAGGHPLPLFIPASSAKPSALVSRNTVLGAARDIDLAMSSRPFAPGDTVIAHTDGLPLAPNIKVLREILAGGAFEVTTAQLETLCQRVWASQHTRNGARRSDDVSVVAFKLAG